MKICEGPSAQIIITHNNLSKLQQYSGNSVKENFSYGRELARKEIKIITVITQHSM
jgi:hypothetical protein